MTGRDRLVPQGISYSPFHELHTYLNRLGSAITELEKSSKHQNGQIYLIKQQIQTLSRTPEEHSTVNPDKDASRIAEPKQSEDSESDVLKDLRCLETSFQELFKRTESLATKIAGYEDQSRLDNEASRSIHSKLKHNEEASIARYSDIVTRITSLERKVHSYTDNGAQQTNRLARLETQVSETLNRVDAIKAENTNVDVSLRKEIRKLDSSLDQNAALNADRSKAQSVELNKVKDSLKDMGRLIMEDADKTQLAKPATTESNSYPQKQQKGISKNCTEHSNEEGMIVELAKASKEIHEGLKEQSTKLERISDELEVLKDADMVQGANINVQSIALRNHLACLDSIRAPSRISSADDMAPGNLFLHKFEELVKRQAATEQRFARTEDKLTAVRNELKASRRDMLPKLPIKDIQSGGAISRAPELSMPEMQGRTIESRVERREIPSPAVTDTRDQYNRTFHAGHRETAPSDRYPPRGPRRGLIPRSRSISPRYRDSRDYRDRRHC